MSYYLITCTYYILHAFLSKISAYMYLHLSQLLSSQLTADTAD